MSLYCQKRQKIVIQRRIKKKLTEKFIFRRDFHISILLAAWPKKRPIPLGQQLNKNVEQQLNLFRKQEVEPYPLV